MTKIFLITLLLSYLVNAATSMRIEFSFSLEPRQGLKELDKIEALPGQPDGFDLAQYSGYVTVNSTAGRALFYYFVESENSESKPLLLWLNGGPGCSSFGYGAMMELGPLLVNQDGETLSLNEFAWTNVANVLFLESPVGVGFSYSNSSEDYELLGDENTAKDSYTFLINWLERFPEYKNRDFYISGESYAGHYVPQLAEQIMQNNKIAKGTVINLRGIIMGNPYIDKETQARGEIDYLGNRNLISDETYQGLISNCNFTYPFQKPTDECVRLWDVMSNNLGNFSSYNIYAPTTCTQSIKPMHQSSECAAKYVENYLNVPQVQRSLHVRAIPQHWQNCNDTTLQLYLVPPTVLPTIQELMVNYGLNIWMYSGDLDSVIPLTTTKYAIKKMGLSIKTSWYPWYHQGEVGGYVVGYENLTFVIVRESGHLVPYDQPARALRLLSSFLEGKLPPAE